MGSEMCIRDRGLSQSTITSYKATFRILMEFLYTVKGIPSDRVEFSTLDDKLIIEFLNWLESERNCSVSTRNQRLSAIVRHSRYMPRTGILVPQLFLGTVC